MMAATVAKGCALVCLGERDSQERHEAKTDLYLVLYLSCVSALGLI